MKIPSNATETPNRSTGPRTPEGKAVSSLNSLKHGITAEAATIPGEDPEEFKTHCQGIADSLHPGNPLELHLVRAIAADYWRIERIRRLEQTHIAEAIGNATEPDLKRLNLYTLYESRLNRTLKNNMAELRQLQAERKEAELTEFQAIAGQAVLDGNPIPEPPARFVSLSDILPPIEELVAADFQGMMMRRAAREAKEKAESSQPTGQKAA